jgi:hypothetical protein
MEPIQDDPPMDDATIVREELDSVAALHVVEALDRLVAERDERTAGEAAWRFVAREWRDKAQDKIAECEALVAERDRLRGVLNIIADGEWVEGNPLEVRDAARAALVKDR